MKPASEEKREKLRHYYLTHPHATYGEVGKACGMAPSNVAMYVKKEGLALKREAMLERSTQKMIDEHLVDEMTAIRLRKLDTGKKLIDHGTANIADAEPVDAIKTGYKLQDEAINPQGGTFNGHTNTNINILLGQSESADFYEKLDTFLDDQYKRLHAGNEEDTSERQ